MPNPPSLFGAIPVPAHTPIVLKTNTLAQAFYASAARDVKPTSKFRFGLVAVDINGTHANEEAELRYMQPMVVSFITPTMCSDIASILKAASESDSRTPPAIRAFAGESYRLYRSIRDGTAHLQQKAV